MIIDKLDVFVLDIYVLTVKGGVRRKDDAVPFNWFCSCTFRDGGMKWDPGVIWRI